MIRTRINRFKDKVSGCGLVGRVVVSDTRSPQFESSHQQYTFLLFSIEKTKINKKRPGMVH